MEPSADLPDMQSLLLYPKWIHETADLWTHNDSLVFASVFYVLPNELDADLQTGPTRLIG